MILIGLAAEIEFRTNFGKKMIDRIEQLRHASDYHGTNLYDRRVKTALYSDAKLA
jgi:hypothetical protein